MFRESLVDSALNRLSFHFGPRLLVHPPATTDVLAELERLVEFVPRDFVIFLSTCNGLRIHADGSDTDLHLWGSPEILASTVSGDGTIVAEALLPVRGDPTGERDWLIGGRGSTRGMLIRWDPWIPGATYVASNFGAYLTAWVEYVMSRYGNDGAKRSATPATVFNREFIQTRDTRLVELSDESQAQQWLHHLDHAVACGDDFE